MKIRIKFRYLILITKIFIFVLIPKNHFKHFLIFQVYFSQFGKVKKIMQLTWGDNGAPKKRGYGFIFFSDFDAVDKVRFLDYW